MSVADQIERLSGEITGQAALIQQVKTVLASKAAGGGGGAVVQELMVTENGTYTPPDGVDGFAPVVVNVDSGGVDVASAIVDRTVTEYIDNECTNIGHSAFRSCTKLKNVDAPNVTTVGDYAFYQCSALTTLNLPAVTSIGQQVVYGCNKLMSLVFPATTTMSQNALREAQYVEVIDFHILTSIPAQAFYGCRGLKALILRSETLVTLSNTSAFTTCYRILGTKNSGFNPNGEKIGFIYVPAALLDEYKTAENWSSDNLVTQLRAIEDYPEICG